MGDVIILMMVKKYWPRHLSMYRQYHFKNRRAKRTKVFRVSNMLKYSSIDISFSMLPLCVASLNICKIMAQSLNFACSFELAIDELHSFLMSSRCVRPSANSRK